MIHIHRIGGYSATAKEGCRDIKALLKAQSGKVFRRTDRYIQLALLGADHFAGNIEPDTALFMSSGEGNLSVFNRLRDQQYIDHQPPRPVDFINSLSNTAGFYVGQHLGLNGKNLFLYHHGFPVQMALILAQNNLELKRERQILVGCVDELLEPVEYTRKFLGICGDLQLGEGSNWLTLRNEKEGALASIDIAPEEMGSKEVSALIEGLDSKSRLAFGMRMPPEDIAAFMEYTACARFDYESYCSYYETVPLYVINRFVEHEKGSLLFIDYFEKRYRVMTLSVFG